MRFLAFLLLALLTVPAQGNDAVFIQAVHNINKNFAPLSKTRANEYAFWINFYSSLYGVDKDLSLAVCTWETGFISRPGDEDQPAIKKSYGLFQLQLETARGISPELEVNPNITALDLLNNYQLNIQLGIFQLSRLLKRYGRLRPALAAYNAGNNGMKKGRGLNYADKVISIYLSKKAGNE